MGVPTAGVVLIGDEILSGKVQDENARFLITELRALGVALRRIAVVPDVVDDIAAAVREQSSRFQWVFTSGGVGPTHDDLTMEAVAKAFGRLLVRDARIEKMIRDHYGDRLEERNLRMAELPEGAELVVGGSLVWPIPLVENVYILPGVPEVFRRKFIAIRERFASAPFCLRVVYTSDDEAHIAADLDWVVASFAGVQVGSYPRFVDRIADGEYRVKVTLEAKDGALVERATAALAARLGGSVVRIADG